MGSVKGPSLRRTATGETRRNLPFACHGANGSTDPNPTFTISRVGDRPAKSGHSHRATPPRQSPVQSGIEQRLGLFEVGGVEAFGEPGVDRGAQGGRLLRPALLAAQAGKAHRTAQFPGFRVLPACDVDALLDGRLGLAHRPGAGEQGLAPEPMELGFERRSPHLFDRLQPGSDRHKRRCGLADRQQRVGLQPQQDMLAHPKTVAPYRPFNLRQSLLAFAGSGERPAVRAKGDQVILRVALLLADPQSPSGMVGGSRRIAAKDVNVGGPLQHPGERQRVPQRLGASCRGPQLREGSIRVAEHPRNQPQIELT